VTPEQSELSAMLFVLFIVCAFLVAAIVSHLVEIRGRPAANGRRKPGSTRTAVGQRTPAMGAVAAGGPRPVAAEPGRVGAHDPETGGSVVIECTFREFVVVAASFLLLVVLPAIARWAEGGDK